MARTRRKFDDDTKKKVAAYAGAHGVPAAVKQFDIVEGVIRRWRNKFATGGQEAGPKRRWTPEKIKEILDYRKTHKIKETVAHFGVSSGQIYVWKTGKNYHLNRKRKSKANGAHPATNGLDELPERDALMWLERWRQAYFDRLKAETPSAANVLAALRGGK